MANETNTNNKAWEQWRMWVREEMKRHSKKLDDIEKSVNDLKVEIAMLKVKSGVWGFAAGAIPVLIMIAVKLLTPD